MFNRFFYRCTDNGSLLINLQLQELWTGFPPQFMQVDLSAKIPPQRPVIIFATCFRFLLPICIRSWGSCWDWRQNLVQLFHSKSISRSPNHTTHLDIEQIYLNRWHELLQTRNQTSVDVVLFRQNIEGEFSMLEHETGRGIEHLKITTEYNTRRLAE